MIIFSTTTTHTTLQHGKMSDKLCSLKSGRRPVSLNPSPVVLTALSVLTAITTATDSIKYPKKATSQEKDQLFYEKVSKLANNHADLSTDAVKATHEFLSASVSYANEVRNAGDEAIERAGDVIYRDLTIEEQTVFDSMDTMDLSKLNHMRAIVELLTIKLRSCYDSNPAVKPEHSTNESLLAMVEHIIKNTVKPAGRFTKKVKDVPKSARFSLGAGADSQDYDEIPEARGALGSQDLE